MKSAQKESQRNGKYLHKPALAQLKIIEENETCAFYYKMGSIFYAPNYEKWKEAVEACYISLQIGDRELNIPVSPMHFMYLPFVIVKTA